MAAAWALWLTGSCSVLLVPFSPVRAGCWAGRPWAARVGPLCPSAPGCARGDTEMTALERVWSLKITIWAAEWAPGPTSCPGFPSCPSWAVQESHSGLSPRGSGAGVRTARLLGSGVGACWGWMPACPLLCPTETGCASDRGWHWVGAPVGHLGRSQQPVQVCRGWYRPYPGEDHLECGAWSHWDLLPGGAGWHWGRSSGFVS